jgi:hypothetical protein
LRHNILAGLNAAQNLDAIAPPAGVLNHNHGVGWQRRRGTRHNCHCLSRRERGNTLSVGTRPDLARDIELSGNLGELRRPNRVAVTGGPGKWRKVTVGVNGFCEHTIHAFEQLDFLSGARPQLGCMLLYEMSSILET